MHARAYVGVQRYGRHMAYDEDLANRIRELLSAQKGIEEKRMFGGLAFLLNGNMSVAASGRGGLMVRIPPDETDKLLTREYVEPMVMAGRETRGWLRVSAEGEVEGLDLHEHGAPAYHPEYAYMGYSPIPAGVNPNAVTGAPVETSTGSSA